jgi:hypothetical protein
MYRARRTLGAPPPGWDLPPGWGQPLDDPQPLQAAGPVGRWVWPTLAVGGFLVVTGFVLAHDDPAPGLSGRGLLAIALAAAVVALLTIRRTAGPGPLARALAEYTVVALLAVLVATTGITLDPPPAGSRQASAAVDHRPALVKTVDTWRDRLVGVWEWLAELWRRADRQTAPRPQSSATTATAPTGEAMAPPPPHPARPGGRYEPAIR